MNELLHLRFSKSFNIIQDGPFHGCSRMGEGEKRPPLPKIYHVYPTVMKPGTVIPYLKKIQKLCKSRDTHHEFCWHQHCFTENQQLLLYQEMQILIAFSRMISNSFNFF